jgi:site-specific DNA-methyltransferase (adenine-specific)
MKKLYFGDCLDILKDLYKEHPQGFIDLIYIDPPFNSKRDYNILFESVDFSDVTAQKQAFADTWSNVSYLDTLNEIKDADLDLWNFLHTLDMVGISKSAVAYLTTMAIRLLYMYKVLKETGSFYLRNRKIILLHYLIPIYLKTL